jgi:hypothetical protein
MEQAITKQLHDAFKKSLEDPTVLASLEKYEEPVIYMNTEDYTRYQREQYAKARVVIGRLGLLLKPDQTHAITDQYRVSPLPRIRKTAGNRH